MSFDDSRIMTSRDVNPAHTRPAADAGADVMQARALLKYDVVNSQGESLGTIEDIMLDVRAGRIAYAVVSCGGVLGVGSRLVAVPWDALRVSPRMGSMILDLDRSSLDRAPTLDMEHPPREAQRWWGEEFSPYYDKKP